ncbi:MAG: agmatinase [Myxococcaceae bacterium]
MTQEFDPNAAADENAGIFGLPYRESDSELVFLPVPWEMTTSYGKGTAKGPEAILRASKQIDLYHPELRCFYEAGLHMLPISTEIASWNLESKTKANLLGEQVNSYVYEQTARLLAQNKLVGVVGGDHSSPFGAIQALAEHHDSFGILHLDAHADTRDAYEGYTWSHASIMRNVLERIPQVTKLVQVGIRDFCEEEFEFSKAQKDRMRVYTDFKLMAAKFEGQPWGVQVSHMIAELPEKVWVSFDIDALDPRFCPHTGTPVPGGLDFQEAYYLIANLVRSGRKIIGFDLCEVGDAEWDGNVGARMLYHLAGWALESR